VVVVGIDARFPGGTHATAAETVLALASGPVCLTGQPGTAGIGKPGGAGSGRHAR
jgi:hypothetical protein